MDTTHVKASSFITYYSTSHAQIWMEGQPCSPLLIPPKTCCHTESSPLVVPYLSPVVLRKEVESFIIQEGGKGLEKEELVRDRCVYRQKGAEGC